MEEEEEEEEEERAEDEAMNVMRLNTMGTAALGALAEIENEDDAAKRDDSDEEEDEMRPRGWSETIGRGMKRASISFSRKSRQLATSARESYDSGVEEEGNNRHAHHQKKSWLGRASGVFKSVGKGVRGGIRKSFGKFGAKKKDDDSPEFDLVGAAMVGEGPLPHVTIEVYDMDFGKRGDFMGEARLNISRIMDVVGKEKVVLPLLPRIGVELKDMDKKEAKLIKGYVEITIDLDYVDAERIRQEANEKEELRKKDPVQALLDEPGVTNGVIGIAVFADVEEERLIIQRQKVEAIRIANKAEAERRRDERETEADELWDMSWEDERSFELTEMDDMEQEDRASREYLDGMLAHHDLTTWTAHWSADEAQHYWFNTVTGFTSWIVPDALNKENWKPRWRPDLGKYLYDNVVTGARNMDQIPYEAEPQPEAMVFAAIMKNGDEDVRVWHIPVSAIEEEEAEAADRRMYGEEEEEGGGGGEEDDDYYGDDGDEGYGAGALVPSPQLEGAGYDYYGEEGQEDEVGYWGDDGAYYYYDDEEE